MPVVQAVRYLSVCSGIEAASVAWHPLGWEAVGFSEIETFPAAVLAHHFPTVPNFGDLTRHAQWNLAPGTVDLVVGGTPCQSFSVAGLRAGMEDPRGNLALTFLALVNRTRPRWVLWENVPGVLSSNGGRDFGAILGALGELGYGWAYRILDAQHFGVPQRRRRVFLVGYLGDWRPPAAILFEPESLRGDTPPRRAKGQGAPAPLGRGFARMQAIGQYALDGTASTLKACDHKEPKDLVIPEAVPFVKAKRAQSAEDDETWEADRPAPTLSVFDSGDTRATVAVVSPPPLTVRRLTPMECERLQGFPDGWTAIPFRGKPAADGPRYKAIGNSMAVPVMRWIGERIKAYEEEP